MASRLIGTTNLSEIDSSNNLYVKSPGYSDTGVEIGGGNDNGNALLTEVDSGTVTASRLIIPPEADIDYRLRTALDLLLDDEVFNYTSQNTGKFNYTNTTMTVGWTAAGMTTNSGSITTTTTGIYFKSYSMFPLVGSGQVVYCQTHASISSIKNKAED
jgi:hypothetical protein